MASANSDRDACSAMGLNPSCTSKRAVVNACWKRDWRPRKNTRTASQSVGRKNRRGSQSSASNADATRRKARTAGIGIRPGAPVLGVAPVSLNNNSSRPDCQWKTYSARVTPLTASTSNAQIRPAINRVPERGKGTNSNNAAPAKPKHSATFGFIVTKPGTTDWSTGTLNIHPASTNRATRIENAPHSEGINLTTLFDVFAQL